MISGALVSSTLTNQLEGNITAIDKNAGASPITKIPYSIKLIIKGKGASPKTFFLTDAMLKVTQVSKIVDGKDVPITIDSLSVGDNIKVKLTWNFDSKVNKYNRLIKGQIQKL